MTTKTSVLTVGGSLNGLSTARFLAHRQVPCVLVERHPGTSIQYGRVPGVMPPGG
jgi:putative polyketide hydroxylase